MRNPHIIETILTNDGSCEEVWYCPGPNRGMNSYAYCEECDEASLLELEQAGTEDGAQCITHGVMHEFLEGEWQVDSGTCGVCEQIDFSGQTFYGDFSSLPDLCLATFNWDEGWYMDECQAIEGATAELIRQQAKTIEEFNEFKCNALDLRELPEPDMTRGDDENFSKYGDGPGMEIMFHWERPLSVSVYRDKKTGKMSVEITEDGVIVLYTADEARAIALAILAAAQKVEQA